MKSPFRKLIDRLLGLAKKSDGQDLVEYALLVAMIAFGVVAGMQSVAASVTGVFNAVVTTLNTALQNDGITSNGGSGNSGGSGQSGDEAQNGGSGNQGGEGNRGGGNRGGEGNRGGSGNRGGNGGDRGGFGNRGFR
jgi:Flp pilus assembly pilin Flp